MNNHLPALINDIRHRNTDNIFCVFINGILSKELSDECSMLEITDHLTIKINKNNIPTKPLHLLFLQTENNQTIQRDHKIIVEENHQLTLIEEYISDNALDYTTQINTEINVQANAQIRFYKIQREHFSATHLSQLDVQQAYNSTVKYFLLTTGAQTAQENLKIALSETNAHCELYGFYGLNRDNQSLNCHLYVDHQAEYAESNMLYKGILDKKSKASFKGKVHVHQQAKKSIARQANHHLLLSNQAEASSQPELEINNDDINCTHGATVGQLDPEALFYLRSRGLDHTAATKLLLHSFAEEVTNHIEDIHIARYMTDLISQNMVTHDYA